MYVFEYLRFNFKTQDFVIRLPITAQNITQNAMQKISVTYGAKGIEQESPAVADKPARLESMPKIAPIRRCYDLWSVTVSAACDKTLRSRGRLNCLSHLPWLRQSAVFSSSTRQTVRCWPLRSVSQRDVRV